MQGARVRALVGEMRSHMPHPHAGVAKNEQTKKKLRFSREPTNPIWRVLKYYKDVYFQKKKNLQ